MLNKGADEVELKINGDRRPNPHFYRKTFYGNEFSIELEAKN